MSNWKKFFWEPFFKLILFGLVTQITVATEIQQNVPHRVNEISVNNNSSIVNWPSLLMIKNTKLQLKINNIYKDLQKNGLNQLFKIKSKETQQNILTRKIRAFPRLIRQECNVSKEKLIQLKNDIKETFLNNTATLNENNCVLNIDENTENCEELIKIIQCGVQHFKNELSITSLNEAIQKKKSYDNFQQISMKIMDQLKKSNNQQYHQEISTLETQLQDMKNKINKLEYDLQDKTTRLCISEISSGKIKSAVTVYENNFMNSKNISILQNIVRTAYNEYGNLNNVNNIVYFIRNFTSCEPAKIALPVLFDLMKVNYPLESTEGMNVLNAVMECMPDSILLATMQEIYLKELFKNLKFTLSKEGSKGIAELITNVTVTVLDPFKLFHK